jgi:hypothetical protein
MMTSYHLAFDGPNNRNGEMFLCVAHKYTAGKPALAPRMKAIRDMPIRHAASFMAPSLCARAV